MQGIEFPKFGKFHVQVFEKGQKIFLSLFRIHDHGHSIIPTVLTGRRCLMQFGQPLGVPVQMLYEQRRTKGGFVMQSTATISVATRSDFKIKGTIDLVFFRPMNPSQVGGHGLFVIFARCVMYMRSEIRTAIRWMLAVIGICGNCSRVPTNHLWSL